VLVPNVIVGFLSEFPPYFSSSIREFIPFFSREEAGILVID
jgi:hypothetical protein